MKSRANFERRLEGLERAVVPLPQRSRAMEVVLGMLELIKHARRSGYEHQVLEDASTEIKRFIKGRANGSLPINTEESRFAALRTSEAFHRFKNAYETWTERKTR